MQWPDGAEDHGGLHGVADSNSKFIESCAVAEVLQVFFVHSFAEVQRKLVPFFLGVSAWFDLGFQKILDNQAGLVAHVDEAHVSVAVLKRWDSS